MFFHDRIKSIKQTDKVLEIGPGGNPHPRSNVLLEKKFDTAEWFAQSGNVQPNSHGKETVFYEGGKFPFQDKEFDYVICSHVLEHVDDIDTFVNEITRVGKAGYIEYPTIYYDYIYNFKVHITLLMKKDGTLYWMPKSESNLHQFKQVQDFFLKTLNEGKHDEMIYQLVDYLMQGFEWSENISTCRTKSIEDVYYDLSKIKILPFVNQDRQRIQKLEADITSLINSKTYKLGKLIANPFSLFKK
ncbi:MAG: methyltransferase domain-containing protein [Bacteroidia bacterium]